VQPAFRRWDVSTLSGGLSGSVPRTGVPPSRESAYTGFLFMPCYLTPLSLRTHHDYKHAAQ
jgi:hypothetical protein